MGQGDAFEGASPFIARANPVTVVELVALRRVAPRSAAQARTEVRLDLVRSVRSARAGLPQRDNFHHPARNSDTPWM